MVLTSTIKSMLSTLELAEPYEGNYLIKQLGCTEAELLALTRLGTLKQKGLHFQLAHPIEWLDPQLIKADIEVASLKVTVHDTLPSTHQFMMTDNSLSPHLLLVEHQNQGIGRRGSPWFTGVASHLTLSLRWPTSKSIEHFSSLNIRLATSLAEHLRTYRDDIQVKWPNDVLINYKKCAGVMSESRSLGTKKGAIVISMGLNLYSPPSGLEFLATGLAQGLALSIDRNALCTKIISKWFALLGDFS